MDSQGPGDASLDATSADASASIDARTDAALPSCTQMDFPARPVPLEMALVVDDVGGVDRALIELSELADLPDLSLSLTLLRHPTAPDRCDASAFEIPFVPMQTVPQVAEDVRAALAISTGGAAGFRTSVAAALQGTYSYLEGRATQAPLAQRAAVLISYNSSNVCDSTVTVDAAFAGDAYRQDPPLLTFVLGPPGSRSEDLDPIAEAGGTEAGSYVDDSEQAWLALFEALQRFRVQATACHTRLPEPDGLRLDTSRVAVEFRSAPDEEAVRWPRLSGPEGCEGGKDGFYYDDPTAPRVLELCPPSCAIARSEAATAELTVAAECVVPLI